MAGNLRGISLIVGMVGFYYCLDRGMLGLGFFLIAVAFCGFYLAGSNGGN
jgi:hypothetical protein